MLWKRKLVQNSAIIYARPAQQIEIFQPQISQWVSRPFVPPIIWVAQSFFSDSDSDQVLPNEILKDGGKKDD